MQMLQQGPCLAYRSIWWLRLNNAICPWNGCLQVADCTAYIYTHACLPQVRVGMGDGAGKRLLPSAMQSADAQAPGVFLHCNCRAQYVEIG